MAFDAGAVIAALALLISFLGAIFKFIDRRKQVRKEQNQAALRQANSDVERDSLVVRGAEGALLLMEKTLKTTSAECEKRISELEEEITDLKCENSNLKQNLKELNSIVEDLNNRLRKVE